MTSHPGPIVPIPDLLAALWEVMTLIIPDIPLMSNVFVLADPRYPQFLFPPAYGLAPSVDTH